MKLTTALLTLLAALSAPAQNQIHDYTNVPVPLGGDMFPSENTNRTAYQYTTWDQMKSQFNAASNLTGTVPPLRLVTNSLMVVGLLVADGTNLYLSTNLPAGMLPSGSSLQGALGSSISNAVNTTGLINTSGNVGCVTLVASGNISLTGASSLFYIRNSTSQAMSTPAAFSLSWAGNFNVATNLTVGQTVTATTGYYFPSNSVTAATVLAGLTNGGSWMGMISNALHVASMSNNVPYWKVIWP
jgi:hypothetical protein